MREKLLVAAIFVAGFGALGWYWLGTAEGIAQTQPPAGAAVLEITVAGEAEGVIRVALRPDLAPQHVERVVELAQSGAYDGVVFHRVIDGFMAQTGDVQFGRDPADLSRAGMGGSRLPNLPAEFSDEPFLRGVMGMARTQAPNSANSQFFLMLDTAPHLNRNYTVVGQMIDGFEVLDAIKRGTGRNGEVQGTPDIMQSVRVVH
jgi:peptidylprolyl isomerase